jgi:translation initiation factor 5B
MTGNYIVSQLVLWDIDFPGGTSNDNIKWRTVIWILSEASLAISAAMSFMPGQQ